MSAAKRRRIEPPPKPKTVKAKKDELYDRCIKEKDIGSDFTIFDLAQFGLTDGENELLAACQELVECHLFAVYNSRSSAVLYRTRTKEDAIKLVKLSNDCLLLYNQIEAVGQNGIWKRTLVTKSNLHENTVTKGLKELINKSLIKEIKSAKYPNKRIYILNYLTPSMENTGGNFYTEGELDTGMIHTLGEWILHYIEQRSWIEKKAKGPKRKATRGKSATDTTDSATKEDFLKFNTPKGPLGGDLVPYEHNYDQYPTAQSILHTLEEEEILKDVTMTTVDVEQLLKHLEFDGQIEEMPTGGYRRVRRAWERNRLNDLYGPLDPEIDGIGPGNGLTQSPCGRCPVFKSCKIGAIVSPETCVYLEEWLNF